MFESFLLCLALVVIFSCFLADPNACYKKRIYGYDAKLFLNNCRSIKDSSNPEQVYSFYMTTFLFGTSFNLASSNLMLIGRFISKDPIGFNGGYNLWGYCANNPINNIDPLGLLKGPITGFDAKTGCEYISKWLEFDHTTINKTLLGPIDRWDYHNWEIVFTKCKCPPIPPSLTGPARVALKVTTKGLLPQEYIYLRGGKRKFSTSWSTSLSRASNQLPFWFTGKWITYKKEYDPPPP